MALVSAVSGPISSQARVLYACSVRIMQVKSRESPVGILSMLVEPMAMICLMTVIFTSIRFRVPMLGDYVMLFLMTGILPVSMFKLGVIQPEMALKKLRKQLVLPQIMPLDLMLSGLTVAVLTMSTLFVGFTFFFWLVYDTPWPSNIVLCAIPVLCNASIAFGFAVLNMLIKSWFLYWGTIFAIMTGPIGIMSGMFFTVDRMPAAIQDILWYNPFMHSTELMRTYYYEEYDSTFFSPIYYYGWAFCALGLGLFLERTFRYRLIKDRE